MVSFFSGKTMNYNLWLQVFLNFTSCGLRDRCYIHGVIFQKISNFLSYKFCITFGYFNYDPQGWPCFWVTGTDVSETSIASIIRVGSKHLYRPNCTASVSENRDINIHCLKNITFLRIAMKVFVTKTEVRFFVYKTQRFVAYKGHVVLVGHWNFGCFHGLNIQLRRKLQDVQTEFWTK